MTGRTLPRDEWGKLAGTDLEPLLPHLSPDSTILVVEGPTGEILGHWAMFQVLHVECVWIDPAHRKAGAVARRLLWQMRQAARAKGARSVCTASVSAEVTALLKKLHAQQLPGDHFVVPIGE